MKSLILIIMLAFNISVFADEYTDIQSAAEKAGVSASLSVSLAQKTKTAGYSPQNLVRIKNMLANAKSSEAQRIAEKAAEGIAKGIPENRVLTAMEKIAERYAYARTLSRRAQIGSKSAEAFTDLAVDALTAGAKAHNLEKVAVSIAQQTEDRDQYAVAVMSLYREMARYGTADEKSSEIAVMAVKKLNVGQINEYKKNFAQNAASGGADSTADEIGKNISRGNGASSSGTGGGGGNGGGRH